MKYCLGIESTAHTFGAGIVSFDGRILANERNVFNSKGGMIPNDVAKLHLSVAQDIVQKAIQNSAILWKDISLISFSAGPGLAPCLHVGMDVAKELANKHKKKLVGVNHCVSHLTIGNLLCKMKDPVYLYVSGANTQVICLAGNRFRIFGETLDIGLGNAFDKFGRIAGLGFPAGPKIEALAKNGKHVTLPYSVKGMDVSFSGIVTNAAKMLDKILLNDICFSLQETCFAMLAEVAERALAHAGKNELLLIGGVGANKRLCQMLDIMCSERNAKFSAVPLEYAGDQGAMIAWQGILQSRNSSNKPDIHPYERTDDVVVDWA